MIYYIASDIYHQSIYSAIRENDEVILGQEINNHLEFLKFMKSNVSILPSDMDKFLLDLSAVDDNDADVLEAIKMFRMLHDHVRILIITERQAGDELLSNLFALGIWNIVATKDFLALKDELAVCLAVGKSFKDAVIFKEIRKDIVTIREEKKLVNKVMLGVMGSQERIGTTHCSISLAVTLRKKGFLVALLEKNQSGDFEKIREGYGAKLFDNYFVMDGIDYYPAVTQKTMIAIKEKSYNFIVMDYGCYENCDLESYFLTHEHFLITGSKPWELHNIAYFLTQYDDDTLMAFHFCFNLTDPANYNAIRKMMHLGEKKNAKELPVYFIDYNTDPFNIQQSNNNINEILKDYLPSAQVKTRKRILERFLNK